MTKDERNYKVKKRTCSPLSRADLNWSNVSLLESIIAIV